MSTDACREWRGALGAAALGGTDPTDEIALRAHLDGCADCRAELRELSAVAGALDAVTRADVIGAPAEPPADLAGRVLDRVAHERADARSRRTRRAVSAVVAFAAAAAVVVGLVAVVGDGGGAGTRVELAGKNGMAARATLRSEPAGTQVDVRVSGLDTGDVYWLWVTGDDGKRVTAGTFRGSDGPARLRLMAALPLSETRRIWVTDEEDRVVLDARLPVSG